MSGTLQMRKMMLADLHHVINKTMKLMDKVKKEDFDDRLAPNMRTIGEIISHLAAVPGSDLLIMQEKSQEDVMNYEKQLQGINDTEALKEAMVSGYKDLTMYMESLSVYAFLNEVTKAFYADEGYTQARWLLEVITHVYHHRSQLYTYMKAKGYEVGMKDLY